MGILGMIPTADAFVREAAPKRDRREHDE